jgi:hypothetical protein
MSGSVACLAVLGSTAALGAQANAARAAVGLAQRPSIPVLAPTVLDRVWCPSATSCWAVGSADVQIGGPTLNQVLRWDGKGWSRVPTPNPSGTSLGGGISEVAGIGCASPAMCWAVGSFSGPPSGSVFNQVLRWNGNGGGGRGNWSLVPAPDPGGTATDSVSELDGVFCPSAGSCWAVGDYHKGRTTLNQVQHWNGRKWRLVTAPSLATSSGDTNLLTDIRCTSSASCWAVGDSTRGSTELNQILRWNGTRWSQAAVPNPGGTRSGDLNALSGVSCAAPRSCWAVGGYGNIGRAGKTLNQVLRWNGTDWTLASSPHPGGTRAGADSSLSDVACSSFAGCWAAGSYVASVRTGAVLNQALHWSGSTWSLVRTPNPAGTASGDSDFLYGIGCASSRKCWAVGLTAQAGEYWLSQLLRWNGTRWAVAVVPS